MDNINLDGDYLSLEQLDVIFRIIPQEIDVLGGNGRVIWPSMNKNRLFKRTEKDISKTVSEVHPDHGQKHVRGVLNQMHVGNRRNIPVMITRGEQPINISFYSPHNGDGKYINCTEIT